VIFKVIKKDKDVINISYIKDIKKKIKDFINLGLKSNKSINKTKRYNKCFKKAIVSIKYYYLFLIFFNLYLVKSINNIKLSIKLSYIKLRQSLLKKRKKVIVLNYNYI
jgi:hypothetical protein